MKWKTIALLSGTIAVTVLLIFFWRARTGQDQPLQTALDGIVNDYRKIIVLMDGSGTLDETTRARCVATGQTLFWRKQRSLRDAEAHVEARAVSVPVRGADPGIGERPQSHCARLAL